MEEVETVVVDQEQLDEVLNEVVNNIKEKFDLVEEPKKRKGPQNPGPKNKKIK